jgi:hypothetical protein
MNRYTLKGLRSGEEPQVVDAASEDDARHEVMCLRWGPPTGIYAPRYKGEGLILIGMEELDEV